VRWARRIEQGDGRHEDREDRLVAQIPAPDASHRVGFGNCVANRPFPLGRAPTQLPLGRRLSADEWSETAAINLDMAEISVTDTEVLGRLDPEWGRGGETRGSPGGERHAVLGKQALCQLSYSRPGAGRV
jgi:hypothetical protein